MRRRSEAGKMRKERGTGRQGRRDVSRPKRVKRRRVDIYHVHLFTYFFFFFSELFCSGIEMEFGFESLIYWLIYR